MAAAPLLGTILGGDIEVWLVALNAILGPSNRVVTGSFGRDDPRLSSSNVVSKERVRAGRRG